MNIYKGIRGYLKVIILSDSPERFLNLCRARDILLWQIDKQDEYYVFCISLNDFRQLKDILKKTKMKVKIIKRFGLPFFMFKYRKHYSFVIGIMLSAIMIYAMSLFVWDISFDGNYSHTDNVLMSYLREQNITPGILVDQISCDSLETGIREHFNDISWVSAEISGTKLIVHVKENDLSIGVDTNDSAVANDIVADMEGTVTKIITRNGTPMVLVGTPVTPGTVLVSGQVGVLNDAKEVVRYNYVSSDADIYIDTQYEYYDELAIEHQYKIYTGKSINKDTYNIWGRQFDIGISFRKFSEFDIITEENVLKLTQNFYLPIRVGRKTYYEYYMSQGNYTIEEANAILYENYNNYLKKLQEKGIQIIDSSVKIEEVDGSYVMNGIVYVNQIQNMHVPVDIDSQNDSLKDVNVR